MNRKTYFEVLGVTPSATDSEIKQAYLVRGKMFHPDRFDRATQAREWELANDLLKELNQAYEILRNPASRSAYALSLHAATPQPAEPTAPYPRRSTRPEPRSWETTAVSRPPSRPRLFAVCFIVGLVSASVALAVVFVQTGGFSRWLPHIPSLLSVSHAEPSPLPLPASGEMQNPLPAVSVAPFQIKAPAGDNFVVKLQRQPGGLVITIFVRAGETARVHVPLGTYVAKYAFGQKWYGYSQLFGPATKYARASRTLSNAPSANLQAPGIPAGEF